MAAAAWRVRRRLRRRSLRAELTAASDLSADAELAVSEPPSPDGENASRSLELAFDGGALHAEGQAEMPRERAPPRGGATSQAAPLSASRPRLWPSRPGQAPEWRRPPVVGLASASRDLRDPRQPARRARFVGYDLLVNRKGGGGGVFQAQGPPCRQ